MNMLKTEEGQHYQSLKISEGRSLVTDLDWFTKYFLAVNPGGDVDYAQDQSVPIGIQIILSDFEGDDSEIEI